LELEKPDVNVFCNLICEKEKETKCERYCKEESQAPPRFRVHRQSHFNALSCHSFRLDVMVRCCTPVVIRAASVALTAGQSYTFQTAAAGSRLTPLVQENVHHLTGELR
jgi:hypothetical protein